jgi:AraC family transcriptional regulator of adaptative response/methylated-DNA-[protein]-cysteine methyltransferase
LRHANRASAAIETRRSIIVTALKRSDQAWRTDERGNAVRFAIGESSFGWILVAASDKGVCAIQFGDDAQGLARDLEASFPEAVPFGDNEQSERLLAKIVGFVEAPAKGLDIPLDVAGNAFEQRVWQAVCEIPAGSTTSYAAVARRIGEPHAAREVAEACASNRLVVAIPCHRVVRSDGRLSGYRWGIKRKRALLNREGVK